MKQAILFITSLFTLLYLTGCEQTVFGVPKDQWDQLSQQQQSQIIEGYNQREQTATQNAPIMAAIGAASSILSSTAQANAAQTTNTHSAITTINSTMNRNNGANFKAPNFVASPDVPMLGGCNTQGNTTHCEYSGSASSHRSNTNFP